MKAALRAAKVDLEGQAPPGAAPDPIEAELAGKAVQKAAKKAAGQPAAKKAAKGKQA